MLLYKKVKPVVPQMNIGMNRLILSMMNVSCCPCINLKRPIELEIADYLIHEAAVMVRVACRSYKK
jgi:hypothetical protein